MDSFNIQISNIIQEYRKSVIQSEAEVRSKLIIPLLDVLGYPSDLRAEEFNVYGYAGKDKLRAKSADFIIFRDRDFADHRENTYRNIKWVEENSLLVVEAKKPGEMPEDLGQAKFYTMWTRAVAYIITDGEQFSAYLYNQINSDYEVINNCVDELACVESITKLKMLTYQSVLLVKSSEKNKQNDFCLPDGLVALTGEDLALLDKNERIGLPEHTLSYMKEALGRNAEGLTEVELARRFLNMTDSYLANDIRYDIPLYMIDFPRHCYSASLYINDNVMPYMKGEITEFYRDDISRYYFKSKYLEIVVVYEKEILEMFEIGYFVLDKSVSDRISSFEVVRQCLWADSICIIIEDDERSTVRRIILPTGKPGNMWVTKQQNIGLFDFWLSRMKKLRRIEEYYEIEFSLETIEGIDTLNELYDSIDIVYDGIELRENCKFKVTGDMFDDEMLIEEPTLLEEDKDLPLADRYIHGYVFRPRRSALLPCKIDFKKKIGKDIIKLPVCIGYDVAKA